MHFVRNHQSLLFVPFHLLFFLDVLKNPLWVFFYLIKIPRQCQPADSWHFHVLFQTWLQKFFIILLLLGLPIQALLQINIFLNMRAVVGKGVFPKISGPSLRLESCLNQKLSIIEFGLKANEIPILYKMPGQIDDAFSPNLNGNIVPGHSCMCHVVQIGDEEISRPIDIANSKIAEISAFPLIIVVIEIVFLVIPSAVTKIEAAQEPTFLINHNYLFVVAP